MVAYVRLCIVSLALSSCPVWAAEPPVAPAAEQAPVTESQQLGREILLDMARYLAGLESYSVTVRSGYDAVQDDGRKIQFLERREVALARPDRFRTDETTADGRSSFILFDGSQITVYDADDNVYAQADQPGSVDDAILYFARDLGMRMPLAALLTTRFEEDLGARLHFADYVDWSRALDVPTHQIVASTGKADAQFWIADGEQPLPRRIVLTYRGEVGQPQYWAEFDDWKVNPRLGEARFEFERPDDARRIVFAVQMMEADRGPDHDASPPVGETP